MVVRKISKETTLGQPLSMSPSKEQMTDLCSRELEQCTTPTAHGNLGRIRFPVQLADRLQVRPLPTMILLGSTVP